MITDGRLVEPLEPCKTESVSLGDPNVITLRIKPNDGICLQFGVKLTGLTADLSSVAMRFSYEAAFGKSSANGYERLLLDAMLGDATLFSKNGETGEWYGAPRSRYRRGTALQPVSVELFCGKDFVFNKTSFWHQ